MKKSEFLSKLRTALENDLSGTIVTENVSYYDDYIRNEVKNGRNEAEVIAELGDPWVIAKTIIDSEEAQIGGEYQRTNTYQSERYTYEDQQNTSSGMAGNIRMFTFDTWWKRLLLFLAIAGVIFLIGTVTVGIFSFFAPILVPLFVIMLVLNIFGRRRR